MPWLLEGDVAERFQTCRDLLHDARPDFQSRIAEEGDGAALLAARGADGSWSSRTSAAPRPPGAQGDGEADLGHGEGGGRWPEPSGTIRNSDACINEMALGYAAYAEAELASVVDFFLAQRLLDGGFNCREP